MIIGENSYVSHKLDVFQVKFKFIHNLLNN